MGFIDSYGRIYKGEFDSIPRNGGTSDRYTFYILKKNYTGDIYNVTCGASPVVHSFLNDEAKPYLKGSEVELNLLNIDNTFPLSNFYSENDDEWMLQLIIRLDNGTQQTNRIIFKGYLVQENCSEELTDIAHEIKLVFTDNLGLLKDISLLDALKRTPNKLYPIRKQLCFIQTKQDANNISYFEVSWFGQFDPIDPNAHPNAGNIIRIENAYIGNGYYTITKVVVNGTKWHIYVEQEMPDISVDTTNWFPQIELTQAQISFIVPYKQDDLLKLIDIYWICVFTTGLALDFAPFTLLNECSETQPIDKKRVLEYTNIYLDCFISDNSSDTLDEILKKINYRFGFTLFQSDGIWCLIRWNELRNTLDITPNPSTAPNRNKLYNYGTYIGGLTTVSFLVQHYFEFADGSNKNTKPRDIGNIEDIEFGVLSSIEMPFKKIQHDFKYEIPDKLIYNMDLSVLGTLVSTTVNGNYTYKRYQAVGWQGNLPPTTYRGTPGRCIEVVYDQYNVEQDRYLVGTNDGLTNDQRYSYLQNFISHDKAIKINKGDVLTFSYDARADQNYSGDLIQRCWLCITTNENDITKYWMLGNDGAWYYVGNDFSYQYIHTNLQFYNAMYDQWQTKTITSQPTPIDGLGFLCFAPLCVGTKETWFKSIEFSIKSYELINNKTGHRHTTTIPNVIKNQEIEEIYVDDSPRSNIKGTLFLPSIANAINKRTSLWNDGKSLWKTSLGELECKQEHLWRNKIRMKLDGNLWCIIKNQGTTSVDYLSMLSVLNFQIKSGTYLIFGKLDLDYKMNQAKFTAFEMWRKGEEWYSPEGPTHPPYLGGINMDQSIKYTFNYLV